MQTFIALHLQNPAMTWLAIAALFVAFSLASGLARLMAPALGAAATAAVCVLAPRQGSAVEGVVFLVATLALVAAHLARRRLASAQAAPPVDGPVRAGPLQTGSLHGEDLRAAPAHRGFLGAGSLRPALTGADEAQASVAEPLFSEGLFETPAVPADAALGFVRRGGVVGAADDLDPERETLPPRRAAGL